MRTVTLYTRHDCHLCEDAHETLLEARDRVAFALEIVDIDRDPALHRRYNWEVPVVAIDGVERFRHRFRVEELIRSLESSS